jgi:hypothetical protein
MIKTERRVSGTGSMRAAGGAAREVFDRGRAGAWLGFFVGMAWRPD